MPDEVYVLAPVAAYAAGLYTRAPEEVYTPLLPLRLYGDEWPRLLARPLGIWADQVCSLPGGARSATSCLALRREGGVQRTARDASKSGYSVGVPLNAGLCAGRGAGTVGVEECHITTLELSELMRGIHAVRSNWSLRAALTRPSLRRRKDMSMSSALALHRRPPRSACAAAFAVALASAAALDALRRRRAPLLHRLPTPTSAAVPARLHRTAGHEGLMCPRF